MRKTALFLFIVAACVLVFPAHAEFKAGAALRVITPDPLLPVSGGVGTPEPATIKNDDLWARALVFEKDGTRVAIVSVDSLGFTSVLMNRARAKITGVPAENVLIGCTHTHSAPDMYAFPDEKGNIGADLNYLDWMCGQIADAVNEAVTRLQPAVIKTAVDNAEGKIAYNYYAPELYDPRCGVIQAIAAADGARKSGEVIATLVNYAIHPEVIGDGQSMLGPDLCGPLYDRIEEKTGGGMAIFMNSAQGGMVTADCRGPEGHDIQTWDECIRIGNLLADEALRIVEKAPVQDNPGLYVAARQIAFPMGSKLLKYVLEHSPLKGDLNPDGSVPTRLNLINIGPAQILSIPGEALPNIGYYVKRNMNTKQPFLFGLTNDAFGYILARIDWKSFERYNYITQTGLGEMTGEIYMDEVVKFVQESPCPDGFTPRSK